MFETLPSPSLETLLIIGRALMLMGAFWVFALAFTRWRRANERDTQQLHAQVERSLVEMRRLHETISVMSARIEALSERVETGSKTAPTGVVGAHRGYDLATRLARNGSDIDELVASCGITRHEAELLTRLHGSKRPESAAPIQQRAAPVMASQPASTWPAQEEAPPPPARTAGRQRGSLLSVVG